MNATPATPGVRSGVAWRVIALAAGAMIGTGCASPPGPFDAWLDEPIARDAHDADLRAQAAHQPAATADAGEGEALALGPESGPEDYARLAVQRSPAVRAARYRLAGLSQRIPQETSLDDPMFRVMRLGRTGSTEAELELSQRFPWPGKLDAQGAVAQQEVAAAAAELERIKQQTAAAARRAFWQLYLADRSIEQTQQSLRVLEQIRDIAQARLRVGAAGQADALRAGVELSEVDRRLTALQQQRATAAALLNRLLDRSADAPIPMPAPLEPTFVELEQDTILTLAAQHHPSLQALREQVAAHRQRLRLARLSPIPDLELGVSYEPMDGEEDEWWFNVGFNLPIWTRRYEAEQRQARAGVLESLAQLTDQQRQVFFEAQSALLALQSQQEQVRMLREQILPQARQALEAGLAGYRAGSADLLDVLDDWQRLLALELIHQESVSGLGIALADLREAVGGQWPLPTPPEATSEPAATQEASLQPSWAQRLEVQP